MNDTSFTKLQETIDELVRASNLFAWLRYQAKINENESLVRKHAENSIEFEKTLLDIADKLADLSSEVNLPCNSSTSLES